MSIAAPRRQFSFEDYLTVEEMSPAVKHEYVRGEIFAMAGGSVEQAALSAALLGMLVPHLRGGPCRAYSSDLRVRIQAADVSTYADATIVCDPVERDGLSLTHVTNPRVVFEVLSPGTESYDRGEKHGYYQQLPSLREYVLVAQDGRRIELWRRDDGGDWTHAVYGAGATAALDSIEYELAVDELYDLAGVALS